MKALEVLKRPFLFLWALVRPSRLPRCPRCKEFLDAHNDHAPYQCQRRCETCEFAARDGWLAGQIITYCAHPRRLGRWRMKTDWCRKWAPRKDKT